MAGRSATTNTQLIAHVALPDCDQRLPDRLGGPPAPPAAGGFGGRVGPARALCPGEHVAWLQPLPDSMLDAGDPASAVIDRSSLRLAFAAALQHLSARRRGTLILRDVLSFSASETADILGTTVVSVNSSLQRARTRVKEVEANDRLGEPSAAEQRAWVDRYMLAFEQADVEGLKRLLTEDVIMEMPPMLNWFAGPRNYGLFMDWVFEQAGTDWRLQTVAANGQPGFAAYRRAGRWLRVAHAPDLHRLRRGHQPEFGVPGSRGLRVVRAGGRARRSVRWRSSAVNLDSTKEVSVTAELLRASEAARRLGISTKEFLRLVHGREIRYEMVEGIAHIPTDAVEEYRAQAS